MLRVFKRPYLKNYSTATSLEMHPNAFFNFTSVREIRASIRLPVPEMYFFAKSQILIFSSEHMPQPAYNNLCGSQVESDEARRHLYFHWSVNFYFYLGEALFAAPSFSN
jgi:hypothetical protein